MPRRTFRWRGLGIEALYAMVEWLVRKPTQAIGIMGNIIVTGITFGVFMTEALIHYNMGQSKARGEFKLTLPPPNELAKIAAVTATFSIVTGLLIKALPKNVQSKI